MATSVLAPKEESRVFSQAFLRDIAKATLRAVVFFMLPVFAFLLWALR
jgi:hypothetical protein